MSFRAQALETTLVDTLKQEASTQSRSAPMDCAATDRHRAVAGERLDPVKHDEPDMHRKTRVH